MPRFFQGTPPLCASRPGAGWTSPEIVEVDAFYFTPPNYEPSRAYMMVVLGKFNFRGVAVFSWANAERALDEFREGALRTLAIPRFDPASGAWEPWLLLQMGGSANTFGRREVNRLRLDQVSTDADPDPPGSTTPVSEVLAAEGRARVRIAMEFLTELEQLILRLHSEDHDLTAIAEATGIRLPNTVAVNKMRALAKLKEFLWALDRVETGPGQQCFRGWLGCLTVQERALPWPLVVDALAGDRPAMSAARAALPEKTRKDLAAAVKKVRVFSEVQSALRGVGLPGSAAAGILVTRTLPSVPPARFLAWPHILAATSAAAAAQLVIDAKSEHWEAFFMVLRLTFGTATQLPPP